MTAHLSRREIHPRTTARHAAARLRRLAVTLTAAACGLLASALIIPAASARTTMLPHPDPGGAGGTTPSTLVPGNAGVVPGGGMAGWQITLIAVSAALVAATAAVLLDRARAARRSASATSA
jgi:hypothetical protein